MGEGSEGRLGIECSPTPYVEAEATLGRGGEGTMGSGRDPGRAARTGRWRQRKMLILPDEAYRIKNRESKTYKACCALTACYRWTATGTPCQLVYERLEFPILWIFCLDLIGLMELPGRNLCREGDLRREWVLTLKKRRRATRPAHFCVILWCCR